MNDWLYAKAVTATSKPRQSIRTMSRRSPERSARYAMSGVKPIRMTCGTAMTNAICSSLKSREASHNGMYGKYTPPMKEYGSVEHGKADGKGRVSPATAGQARPHFI